MRLTVGRIVHLIPRSGMLELGRVGECRAALVLSCRADTALVRVFEENGNDWQTSVVASGESKFWHDPRECPHATLPPGWEEGDAIPRRCQVHGDMFTHRAYIMIIPPDGEPQRFGCIDCANREKRTTP